MSSRRPRSWARRSLRKLTKWLLYQYRVSRRDIVTIEGIRIRVGRHMAPRVERAVSKGAYERDELRLIRLVLSSDDVVLNVGAGLGLVSVFCAKQLGSGQVFAFEANPDLEPRIRENFALNGVEPALDMCAVRATAGRVTIFRRKHIFTPSVLAPRDGADSLEVPGKALGYLIEKVRPTLLIVGMESVEAELFVGSELPGLRKIVLELHEHVVGVDKKRRVHAALTALGFREDHGLSSGEHLVLRR
ncbi:MAG TPA: FkbM family methyltransferase [Gemmatimonadales bacterium]|nr:FkbM family methyltransferase [Gemmatimonadales bacterium]